MDPGAQGGPAPIGRRLTIYALALVALASVYPFVAFLDRNRDEVAQTGRLAVYALLAVAAGLVALVVLVAVRPSASADRLAVGVSAFVLSFWSFHVVFASDPNLRRMFAQLVLWALATAAIVVGAYVVSRHAQVRFFALVLVGLLTALPLGEYLVWRVTTDRDAEERAATADVAPAELEDAPNVYYFLLDEYARVDQMRDVLDFDNRPFYDELEERDFVVVDDAHSPFQHTVMSMASVLDMDYIATTPAEARGGDKAFGNRLRGENATVDYFRAAGYDYVYLSPSIFDWSRCDRDLVDYCIEPHGTGWNLEELELSLLDLTPIGSLDLAREAITSPSYAVEQVQQHGDELDEPFFLYAHILSPHSPARYTEDCEIRSRFAYHAMPVKSDADRANYVQDVRCMNDDVLRAVDAVLADDPDAIVIVASDHGSKFIPDTYKRLEEWRPEALREEFGALFAMHVPERCRESAADLTNTVNTFRVVAGCLEGRPPTVVDDRVFLWPSEGPGPQEIEDVSVLDPVE